MEEKDRLKARSGTAVSRLLRSTMIAVLISAYQAVERSQVEPGRLRPPPFSSRSLVSLRDVPASVVVRGTPGGSHRLTDRKRSAHQ